MCVKLSLEDLYFDPYPPFSTSIYTCRMTITGYTMICVKNFKPYVIYSTELLNLVINLTRYELNRTDKQLTTYINTKSKSSKYESNIGKA